MVYALIGGLILGFLLGCAFVSISYKKNNYGIVEKSKKEDKKEDKNKINIDALNKYYQFLLEECKDRYERKRNYLIDKSDDSYTRGYENGYRDGYTKGKE